MGPSVTITGVEAVAAAFRALPHKVARKVVRQAERKGMKIALAAARANAPVATGAGRKSLRVRSSKGPRGTKIKDTIAMALLVGRGGKPPGKEWYMWLQEFGHYTGRRSREGWTVVCRSGKS